VLLAPKRIEFPARLARIYLKNELGDGRDILKITETQSMQSG
jgi:hypothetical protein